MLGKATPDIQILAFKKSIRLFFGIAAFLWYPYTLNSKKKTFNENVLGSSIIVHLVHIVTIASFTKSGTRELSDKKEYMERLRFFIYFIEIKLGICMLEQRLKVLCAAVQYKKKKRKKL